MKKLFLIYTAIYSIISFGWTGLDSTTQEDIEIEKGTLVRSGEDIEVYNYNQGEYKSYTVESVSSSEVEVYDNDTGDYITLEME